MRFLCTSLLLFSVYLSTAGETYVTCLSCPDVSSPRDCQESLTCGKGEICYAKEYTDHRGRRGFRLGCEDQARCTLFIDATVIGKRDVASAPSDKCYDCCTGDECNGRLCQGGGGSHGSSGLHTTANLPTPVRPTCVCPKPTCPPAACPTFTCPTTTCPASTCPKIISPTTCPKPAPTCTKPFIPNKSSCYFFVNWALNWTDARKFCTSIGEDLVSINSQEEQEFIVKNLTVLAAKSTTDIHIGGAYSASLQEWEWVDRSPVQYTNWQSGYPGTLSHSYDYHMTVANPSANSAYKGGPWYTATTAAYPFICEKRV